MSNDKKTGKPGVEGESAGAESTTRARNRTVMLSPEITGQVRARMAAQEIETAKETAKDPDQFQLPTPAPRTDLPPAIVRNDAGRSEAPARPELGRAEPPRPVPPLGMSSAPEPRPSTGSASGAGAAAASVAAMPRALRPNQPVALQMPAPAPTPADLVSVPVSRIVWSKQTPIVGFLVSFDHDKNGESFELRSGRLVITSEAASTGSYLLIADESVSPMHAIMRVSAGGEVQVLDQLSEAGTFVRRFEAQSEEALSGDKTTVEHGDIIRFGSRAFHVCVLALAEQQR